MSKSKIQSRLYFIVCESYFSLCCILCISVCLQFAKNLPLSFLLYLNLVISLRFPSTQTQTSKLKGCTNTNIIPVLSSEKNSVNCLLKMVTLAVCILESRSQNERLKILHVGKMQIGLSKYAAICPQCTQLKKNVKPCAPNKYFYMRWMLIDMRSAHVISWKRIHFFPFIYKNMTLVTITLMWASNRCVRLTRLPFLTLWKCQSQRAAQQIPLVGHLN